MLPEGVAATEWDTSFDNLLKRLTYLEHWRELAVPPDRAECHPDDLALSDVSINSNVDDVAELTCRCTAVRRAMNSCVTAPEPAKWESFLQPMPSRIPDAGQGLFFMPDKEAMIPESTILCHYWGHLHNYRSAQQDVQDTSYLMFVQDQVIVDAGPVRHVVARFINDPQNENKVNCVFVPRRHCAAVISSRPILAGEEIYASYGDAYWNFQHSIAGIIPQRLPDSD